MLRDADDVPVWLAQKYLTDLVARDCSSTVKPITRSVTYLGELTSTSTAATARFAARLRRKDRE